MKHSEKTVLYCLKANKWKLTDFGICSEATSKKARPTAYSRGTSGYRAPELLVEEATFTNKVDIWSLGCILYKLIALKNVFHSDLEVRIQSLNSIPDIPLATSTFLKDHASNNIRDLLHSDQRSRPRASNLCTLFARYCELSEFRCFGSRIIQSPHYPTYFEWKTLVEMNSSSPQIWCHLVDAFSTAGDESSASALITEIYQRLMSKKLHQVSASVTEKALEDELSVSWRYFIHANVDRENDVRFKFNPLEPGTYL